MKRAKKHQWNFKILMITHNMRKKLVTSKSTRSSTQLMYFQVSLGTTMMRINASLTYWQTLKKTSSSILRLFAIHLFSFGKSMDALCITQVHSFTLLM